MIYKSPQKNKKNNNKINKIKKDKLNYKTLPYHLIR